jgi:hypothetical protein
MSAAQEEEKKRNDVIWAKFDIEQFASSYAEKLAEGLPDSDVEMFLSPSNANAAWADGRIADSVNAAEFSASVDLTSAVWSPGTRKSNPETQRSKRCLPDCLCQSASSWQPMCRLRFSARLITVIGDFSGACTRKTCRDGAHSREKTSFRDWDF